MLFYQSQAIGTLLRTNMVSLISPAIKAYLMEAFFASGQKGHFEHKMYHQDIPLAAEDTSREMSVD